MKAVIKSIPHRHRIFLTRMLSLGLSVLCNLASLRYTMHELGVNANHGLGRLVQSRVARYGLEPPVTGFTNSVLSPSCFLQGVYLTSSKAVNLFLFHEISTICPQLPHD